MYHKSPYSFFVEYSTDPVASPPRADITPVSIPADLSIFSASSIMTSSYDGMITCAGYTSPDVNGDCW